MKMNTIRDVKKPRRVTKECVLGNEWKIWKIIILRKSTKCLEEEKRYTEKITFLNDKQGQLVGRVEEKLEIGGIF